MDDAATPAGPIMDMTRLGHVEPMTPRPDESLAFFTGVPGMTGSRRAGDSVYLRGWDDHERYSQKLTDTNTSGLGHAAFRARGPQASGNRIEVANAGARLVLAPGWKPIRGTQQERKKSQAWGMTAVETFSPHGAPPSPGEPLVAPRIADAQRKRGF